MADVPKRKYGRTGRAFPSRKHKNQCTSEAEKEMLHRRRHFVEGGQVTYVGKETTPCGTEGKKHHQAVVGSYGFVGISRSPVDGIAKAIREALDPVRAPSAVRTLADMTEEEVQELEKRYGAPITRRKKAL